MRQISVCLNVRIKTWFPLVRRFLPSMIISQLISDYISATRCYVVPHTASPAFPPLKYGVAHARKVCPSVRIKTWFPLVRRVLSSVVGSQLISDYISATRCSVVPSNASPIFLPLKYGVAHARKVCSSVRIRTWFPLVRRVLPPMIVSQLISDYISATRCSLVPHNASPIFSGTQVWGSPVSYTHLTLPTNREV